MTDEERLALLKRGAEEARQLAARARANEDAAEARLAELASTLRDRHGCATPDQARQKASVLRAEVGKLMDTIEKKLGTVA